MTTEELEAAQRLTRAINLLKGTEIALQKSFPNDGTGVKHLQSVAIPNEVFDQVKTIILAASGTKITALEAQLNSL